MEDPNTAAAANAVAAGRNLWQNIFGLQQMKMQQAQSAQQVQAAKYQNLATGVDLAKSRADFSGISGVSGVRSRVNNPGLPSTADDSDTDFSGTPSGASKAPSGASSAPSLPPVTPPMTAALAPPGASQTLPAPAGLPQTPPPYGPMGLPQTPPAAPNAVTAPQANTPTDQMAGTSRPSTAPAAPPVSGTSVAAPGTGVQAPGSAPLDKTQFPNIAMNNDEGEAGSGSGKMNPWNTLSDSTQQSVIDAVKASGKKMGIDMTSQDAMDEYNARVARSSLGNSEVLQATLDSTGKAQFQIYPNMGDDSSVGSGPYSRLARVNPELYKTYTEQNSAAFTGNQQVKDANDVYAIASDVKRIASQPTVTGNSAHELAVKFARLLNPQMRGQPNDVIEANIKNGGLKEKSQTFLSGLLNGETVSKTDLNDLRREAIRINETSRRSAMESVQQSLNFLTANGNMLSPGVRLQEGMFPRSLADAPPQRLPNVTGLKGRVATNAGGGTQEGGSTMSVGAPGASQPQRGGKSNADILRAFRARNAQGQ